MDSAAGEFTIASASTSTTNVMGGMKKMMPLLTFGCADVYVCVCVCVRVRVWNVATEM